MRPIILKLIMSAALSACTIITPQQLLLQYRLSQFNVKYDAIMDNVHASQLSKPPSQAQIVHIEAVQKQSEDLMEELGCFKGNFTFGCASLLAKDVLLKFKVLCTQFDLLKFEKEEADAKAEAEKGLKSVEGAAEL